MATMREEIDKYKAQVNQYDAGRPTTMSADKIGNRIVPDGGQRFDPSYDAKVQSPAQVRTAMPVAPVGGTDRQFQNIKDAASGATGAGARKVLQFGENVIEGGLLGANPNVPRQPIQTRAMPDSALPGTKPLAVRNPSQPVALETAAPDGKNSWSGNYAAQDASGQGIFTDPATGRTSIRLTGEAGGEFMQDQNKIIADGGGKADGRKAMPLGEYGGTYAQFPRASVPVTANPGLTLRATPVTTRNPIADQRNAEAALATRQREVMDMERADKTLMQAPGSRDYISPTLTEPEQRARQSEIATQRKQDREDVISGNVARATIAATNDMATGKTSDRNLAMIPYAERRAIINTRDGLMDNSASIEKDRKAVATADAERAAKEKQDVRKDATDRYVADSNTALAQTNAQVSAESKRLDRAATREAALIKVENTADPIQLERVKGYNAAITAMMSMGQTPTAEQLLEMQTTYGVADLLKPADPLSKIKINAPSQG